MTNVMPEQQPHHNSVHLYSAEAQKVSNALIIK